MADYTKLKVAELKEILKERGIPSTGLSRKQQIVDALEAHDASHGGANADALKESHIEPEREEVGEGAEVTQKADEDVVEVPPAVEGTQSEEKRAEVTENVGEVAAVSEVPVSTSSEAVQTSAPISDLPAEAASAEPTVLDKHEPVPEEASTLITPQRSPPPNESQSSDTRKRKRRSPTPPPSAESVNKKLKSAEDLSVKLPEDEVMQDAPIPVATEGEKEDGLEREKVVPYSTSDDVMAVQITSEHAATADSPGPLPPSEQHVVEDKMNEGPDSMPRKPPITADGDTATSPAIHPATRALYISQFVRPLQPNQLRDHLITLATPPNSGPDDSIIETFHLDAIRTHAFVVFTSASAASRTRSALHDRIWPDEPARRPLWVDFVPEEKVQEWIDTELSAGSSRRDAKKWEVVYSQGEEGTETTLQEIGPSIPHGPGQALRQPSFSGQGMPNAPLGPRANRPLGPSGPSEPPAAPSPERTKKPTPSTESFDVLDQRFSFTTAKPKMYYLPVSKELVDQRLDELDTQTSREWDGGRALAGSSAVETQLRRYTFEDGARLVDGGPDIGNFGRGGPPGGGGGFSSGGRGRGRGGGGGGYRGRW